MGPNTIFINTFLLGNKAIVQVQKRQNNKTKHLSKNLNFTGETEHTQRKMNYIMQDNIWQESHEWERE